MCKKCVDALKKYYPELPESDRATLLSGATSFPFGNPDEVETQLVELREKTEPPLTVVIVD